MAQTVKVVTTDPDHPVRWPKYCAECGAKDGLVSVSTQVVDVKTVKPWMLLLGEHHTEHHTLKMGYPVCPTHARGLPLAHWITQNGGVPRIVRGVVYFFIVTMVLAVGVAIMSSLNKAGVNATAGAAKVATRAREPIQWGSMVFTLATMLLPFAALAFVLHAYKKVPLRLTRLEDDAVTIRFKVNRFARAFERSNSDIVV